MVDGTISDEQYKQMDEIAAKKEKRAREEKLAAASVVVENKPKNPGKLRNFLSNLNIGSASYLEQMSEYNKWTSEHPETAETKVTSESEEVITEEAGDVVGALDTDEGELSTMAEKGNLDPAIAAEATQQIESLKEAAQQTAAAAAAEIKKPSLWSRLKETFTGPVDHTDEIADKMAFDKKAEQYKKLTKGDKEVFDLIKSISGSDAKRKTDIVKTLNLHGKNITDNLREWLDNASFLPTDAEIADPTLIKASQTETSSGGTPIESPRDQVYEKNRLDVLKNSFVNKYIADATKELRRTIERLKAGIKMNFDDVIKDLKDEIANLESQPNEHIINIIDANTSDIDALQKDGFSPEQVAKILEATKALLAEAQDAKKSIATKESETATVEAAAETPKFRSGQKVKDEISKQILTYNGEDGKMMSLTNEKGEEFKIEKYFLKDLKAIPENQTESEEAEDEDENTIVPDMGGMRMPEAQIEEDAPIAEKEEVVEATEDDDDNAIVPDMGGMRMPEAQIEEEASIAEKEESTETTKSEGDTTGATVEEATTKPPEAKTETASGFDKIKNILRLDGGEEINFANLGLTAEERPSKHKSSIDLNVLGKDGKALFSVSIRKEDDGNFTLRTNKFLEDKNAASGSIEKNIKPVDLKRKIDKEIETILVHSAKAENSEAAAA